MTHTLETERLILRKPKAADFEQFKAFASVGGLEHIYGDVTKGQIFRSFASEIGHWEIRGFGQWSVTEKGNDTAIGMVGPWFPDNWPEKEIGWMVFGNAQGKGIAYEAALAVRADVFGRLNWATAVSYIAPENTRSINLAKRLGAVLDPNACIPKEDEDEPCLVYRHHAPEAA